MHLHDKGERKNRLKNSRNIQEQENSNVNSGLSFNPPPLKLTSPEFTPSQNDHFANTNQDSLYPLQAKLHQSLPETGLSKDDNKNSEVVIQRDIIPIETVESPPARPEFSIQELVTDTLRTLRAIVGNYNTALDNFETAVSNESGQEAAPPNAAEIALREVTRTLTSSLTGLLTSMVPGGSFINTLLGLGQSIETAIQQARGSAGAAANRNLAANFIINARTSVAQTNSRLESNMTEAINAAVGRHNNADSGLQSALRREYERVNHQVTQRLNGNFSASGLFVKLAQQWINSTNSPSSGRAPRPSKVFIHLNQNWELISAHIDAPFGSRIAEQLTNVASQTEGGLSLRDFLVPRVLYWYPTSDAINIACKVQGEVPPENNSLNNVGANMLGGRYLRQFIQNVRTLPIPNAQSLTGATVS